MTSTTAAAKPWRFTSLQEDTVITAAGVAATAVFVAGTAAVFSPLALGLAAGYCALKVGHTYAAMAFRPIRDQALKSMHKSRHYKPVPADSKIVALVAEQSKRLGWAEAPPVYLVDAKTVAKMALPFGLRWLMNNPKTRNTVMPKVFAAVPGMNIIFTTQEALNTMHDEQLAFITAHEMSHLKKEALSLPVFVKAAKQRLTEGLGGLVLIGGGLALAGVSVPLFTGGAIVAMVGLVGATVAAGVINNIGVRTYERRADRNGLYLNQAEATLANSVESFKAARSVFEKLHDKALWAAKKELLLTEIFLTHPSQRRRDIALKRSFAHVVNHIDPNADAKVLLREMDQVQKPAFNGWFNG